MLMHCKCYLVKKYLSVWSQLLFGVGIGQSLLKCHAHKGERGLLFYGKTWFRGTV